MVNYSIRKFIAAAKRIHNVVVSLLNHYRLTQSIWPANMESKVHFEGMWTVPFVAYAW
jgi:hypothetical protein